MSSTLMHIRMDWRSTLFDWNRARAFLVTAEEGSLSAAARALGLTQPTLGRQVAALEAELGVTLFLRAGNRLELTDSGRELVEHARAMGAAALAVSRAASGQSEAIEGSVRITASETGSVFMLAPIVARLRLAEPGIAVEIVANDSLADLNRREADIALRNVRPTDPDLIARKIRDETAHLYASQGYLERAGPFETIADLARADYVGIAQNQPLLQGLTSLGIGLTEASFTTRSGSHLVHWELVKQGAGIGVMASLVGDAEPKVARAAPWLEPFSFPIWLVAHRELRTSRRIRLVFDWLEREIAAF